MFPDSEDRNKMGLVGNMSVGKSDSSGYKVSTFSAGRDFILRRRKSTDLPLDLQKRTISGVHPWIRRYWNLGRQSIEGLSLARELSRNPDLLVAVHPTRAGHQTAKFMHDTMEGHVTRLWDSPHQRSFDEI